VVAPRCNCDEIPGQGPEPESATEGRATAGSTVVHASMIMTTEMMSQALRLALLHLTTTSWCRVVASGLLHAPV